MNSREIIKELIEKQKINLKEIERISDSLYDVWFNDKTKKSKTACHEAWLLLEKILKELNNEEE